MYYDALRRILEAFTMSRPDVGYVQGMSYIAGILLVYNEEYAAFVLFHRMVTSATLLPFFTLNAEQVQK